MPLKNSLGVERRIDLASLFCMIGRHGPAVAVAIIAMVSVLAGIVIYRNVREKRRKAEVDASEGRSRGEPRDESERERRSAPLTDESDEDPPDVPRKARPIQSDFTTRKRQIEKKQPPHYSPHGGDTQMVDSCQFVKSFSRDGDVDSGRVQRDDYKVKEKQGEKVADGWMAQWTSASPDYECGLKEAQHFTDNHGSEKKIQKEDSAEGSNTSSDNVNVHKRNGLDQIQEDVVKQEATDFLQEESVVASKDFGYVEEFKTEKCSDYNKYNVSVDVGSSQRNTEEKSISVSDAVAEEDKSEALFCQNQCGQGTSLKSRDLEETFEPLCECTEKHDDYMPGSFVEDEPSLAPKALVLDSLPPSGLTEENSDLQRGSVGSEDERRNGFTDGSIEEHDARVEVPSCDLRPEPAHEVSNGEVPVSPVSIACDAGSKVKDEVISLQSVATESFRTMNEAGNGHIPTIVLHEVEDDSLVMDFVRHSLDTADVLREDDHSFSKRTSNSTVNEAPSKEDSSAKLGPDVDLKSEPLNGKTNDSTAVEKSVCTDLRTIDCPLATSRMVDDSIPQINSSVTDQAPSQSSVDEPGPDTMPHVNMNACEGQHLSEESLDQSADPETIDCDTNSTVAEETSVSSTGEYQDQQDGNMDWKTSDETCVGVTADETSEEPPSESLPCHEESMEDFTGLVTAEFSAMTVNIEFPSTAPHQTSLSFGNDETLVPTIAVISEVTEIDCTELQMMDSEPQTQTTVYADDATVYVAKVESKLEAYAVNEDALGHEIEDSYHDLVEKLMVQVVATLTDERTDASAVADPDEKKERGSSVKKVTGKEKDEEEVTEKTEISIMEATMDHNEWITDGNYQTLPWMNLGLQVKTDQRPDPVEPLQHLLTSNSSVDIETPPSDGKPTSNASLVEENTDNGKKILAVQPMAQNVNVTFRVHYITHSPYHTVAITGNQQELGNWKGFVPLEKAKDGLWMSVLSLPAESLVEWKFVLVEEGAVCRWEECGNRLLDTGCGDDVLVHKCWGFL